jgi:hypothetical protein
MSISFAVFFFFPFFPTGDFSVRTPGFRYGTTICFIGSLKKPVGSASGTWESGLIPDPDAPKGRVVTVSFARSSSHSSGWCIDLVAPQSHRSSLVAIKGALHYSHTFRLTSL